MQDRVPTPGQEGRVLITPENGGPAFYATVEMADNPTQPGTPWNKESVLQDSTAAALGLPATAVPDDAFLAIDEEINATQDTALSLALQAMGEGSGKSVSLPVTYSGNIGLTLGSGSSIATMTVPLSSLPNAAKVSFIKAPPAKTTSSGNGPAVKMNYAIQLILKGSAITVDSGTASLAADILSAIESLPSYNTMVEVGFYLSNADSIVYQIKTRRASGSGYSYATLGGMQNSTVQYLQ